MVQIIPQEGLGELLGKGFGGGIAQGVQSGSNMLINMLMKKISDKQENDQIMAMVEKAKTIGKSTSEQPTQDQPEGSPLENMAGGQQSSPLENMADTQQNQQSDADPMPQGTDPNLLLGLSLKGGQKGVNVAKSLVEQDKLSSDKWKAQSKLQQTKDLAYIKTNEPEMLKLQDRISSLEKSDIEFARLDEIFTNSSDKLPKSYTAAMFNLEGEGGLSEFGRSQLSTEAQETIKLVTNQIRGLKDTFPGRILQTELDKYMKTLPGLLNTPDGRKQILRDLRILNKMGRLDSEQTVNEMQKGGGSSKILMSDARNNAKKTIKPKIDMLKDMFINPNKREFESLPDASLLKGEELVDELGQSLISDGKNWIPKEGGK